MDLQIRTRKNRIIKEIFGCVWIVLSVLYGIFVCDSLVYADTATTEANVFGDYLYSEYTNMYGEGWTIQLYKGSDVIVDIPDSIEGKPVLKIGNNAFSNCTYLEDIYIPDTVTEIGENAFSNCVSLKRVVMLSNATNYNIADSAFLNCNDELALVIAESTSLDAYVQTLELPYMYVQDANLPQYSYNTLQDGTVEVYAIDLYEKTPQLAIPDTIDGKMVSSIAYLYLYSMDYDDGALSLTIPHTVTNIEENVNWTKFNKISVSKANTAFIVKNNDLYDITMENLIFSMYKGDTSYIIPSGVKYLYENALELCQATSITLPSSIEDLSNGALLKCYNLSEIIVDKDNQNYISNSGIVYTKDMMAVVAYPCGKSEVSYVIPDGITNIGDRALQNSRNLKSITVPDGIETIGNQAFSSSGITSIELPDSITTIDGGAFERCSYLKSVILPNGITSISSSLFAQCTQLKEISIPDSVKTIGDEAFYYCNGLKNFTLPSQIQSIGRRSFSFCTSLTSVSLPDSLASIGEYAFEYCSSITSIVLPEGISSISSGAFAHCKNLKMIDIPDSVKTIGTYAFGYCTMLNVCVIPDSVTTIDWYAFGNCSALSVCIVPKTVTSIGYGNFKYCSSDIVLVVEKDSKAETYAKSNGINYMYREDSEESVEFEYEILANDTLKITGYTGNGTEVSVPAQISGRIVTEIGEQAFYKNSSVSEVRLPNTVVTIGKQAFAYSKKLENIVFTNNVSEIGEQAFQGCICLTNITLPGSLSKISEALFSGCTKLSNVVIGNKVTLIKSSAFSDCIFLTTITIPDSVKTIEAYTFSGCTSLESVNIPKGVSEITAATFEGCVNLQEFVINESYYYKSVNGILCNSRGTSIVLCPQGLLNGMFEIPEGITSISSKAFANSMKLTGITIPASVTSIATDAFYGCSGLEEILVADENEKYSSKDGVLLDKLQTKIISCPNGKKGIYEVPAGITDINKSAFLQCEQLTEVILSENITKILDSTFSGCTNITEFEIPDGVVSIGANAFANCTALEKILIPASVTSIHETAYENCSDKLTFVVEAASYGESFARKQGIQFQYPYVAVSSLALDRVIATMNVGENLSLTTIVLPVEASNKDVTWTSNNSAIVTVSNNGIVTATGVGEAVITATTVDGGYKASCKIIVKDTPKTNPDIEADQPIVDEKIKVGDRIETLGIVYEVTSLDNYCVSCIGLADENLENVNLPNSVDIKGEAYKVTTISANAFKNNKKISSIRIGKEVVSIEEQAFLNCKALKNIKIDTVKLIQIGKNAFKGVAKNAQYISPAASKKLYMSMVEGSKKGTCIVVSGGIYQVPNMKKSTATFLKPVKEKASSVIIASEITIQKKKYKVSAIANSAFKNNKRIKKVTIGKNVTTIGGNAFTGCNKLQKIIIQSRKIKKVGKSKLARKISFVPPAGKKEEYRKLFTKYFK